MRSCSIYGNTYTCDKYSKTLQDWEKKACSQALFTTLRTDSGPSVPPKVGGAAAVRAVSRVARREETAALALSP